MDVWTYDNRCGAQKTLGFVMKHHFTIQNLVLDQRKQVIGSIFCAYTRLRKFY
jgi:hypothetical protein